MHNVQDTFTLDNTVELELWFFVPVFQVLVKVAVLFVVMWFVVLVVSSIVVLILLRTIIVAIAIALWLIVLFGLGTLSL